MADMFADRQLKRIIREICDNPNAYDTDLKIIWFNLTKDMFAVVPALEVFLLVEKALEEFSDEQWFENKYPKEIFNENFIFPKKKKSVIKINLKQSRLKKLINDNIKITDVAKSYGLNPKGKGNMVVCPFHADTQASLGFDNTKNIFHCFGCNAKGDIIDFKRRMKKCQKEMKQQKNF
ncbi:MAG: hypothetical protein EHM47_00980 [Ignavibacteriales bacterium]|nr:MAG: hypothetical protein EHM47_00980 [Ignavibacteriales bacterium]